MVAVPGAFVLAEASDCSAADAIAGWFGEKVFWTYLLAELQEELHSNNPKAAA
ncbi:hypothetical protein [Planctomicrobium sp. SH527]|uniref:hypothetical protein n=1 Tax=Planctomicrobium sp. SH527 TaxID=3448123 RepID=UPI003F5C043F